LLTETPDAFEYRSHLRYSEEGRVMVIGALLFDWSAASCPLVCAEVASPFIWAGLAGFSGTNPSRQ
jgi:hypothetical protein